MDRFWNKVDQSGDCWLWTAAPDTAGYGQFKFEGKNIKAHRMSYYLTHGVWPNICRHKCDNPPCVRPDHLVEGSHKDNSDDKFERDRGWWDLTVEQVKNMRSREMTITVVYELAREFNTTEDIVKRALNGNSFKGLPGAVHVPRQKSLNTKLSIKQVREIKQELQTPWWGQVNHLANKYGVDHSEISHIKSGHTHADVSI